MADSLETVSYGLLYPSLLSVIPNTGTQWLDYALNQAAIDLARRTRVLRITMVQDAQAGVVDYPIELPDGYEIIYVEDVCINGEKPAPSRDLPCNVVNPEDGTCTIQWPQSCAFSPTCCGNPGAGQFNVLDNGASITLSQAPRYDGPMGVRIEVSIVPSRTACALPKIMYERYSRAIVDQAISQLALSPEAKGISAGKLKALDRRAEISTKRAKLDADAAYVVGPGYINVPTGQFLI